jgi:hypothetical protein
MHPLEMHPRRVNSVKKLDTNTSYQCFFDKPPQLLKYEYVSNTCLTKKDIKQCFDTFIKDINNVKLGKCDNPTDVISYSHTHLTKLPVLYKELTKEPILQFPIWYKPNRELMSGFGRLLIISRYFKQMKFDRVYNRLEYGGNLDGLLDKIKSNDYWKNRDVSKLNTFVMLSNFEKYPHQLFVRHVTFTDWDSSKKFCIEPWDEDILHNLDIWESMKKTIINFNAENIKDYINLLDILVHEYS